VRARRLHAATLTRGTRLGRRDHHRTPTHRDGPPLGLMNTMTAAGGAPGPRWLRGGPGQGVICSLLPAGKLATATPLPQRRLLSPRSCCTRWLHPRSRWARGSKNCPDLRVPYTYKNSYGDVCCLQPPADDLGRRAGSCVLSPRRHSSARGLAHAPPGASSLPPALSPPHTFTVAPGHRRTRNMHFRSQAGTKSPAPPRGPRCG
jgi:hypothetical protein